MKVEILVGLIAIGVIGAVFIPLAFDPAGVGGIDFIECEADEIMKYILVNGTLNWDCAVDETTLTEIDIPTFGNENTEFRPHLVRGTNVQDPIINFGDYSVRVMEFLPDEFGEVSWDYLVPKDYEIGEDLEFTVYWFKEDGLPDTEKIDSYTEESTACLNTGLNGETQMITITDGVEYNFEQDKEYLIFATTSWGADPNHKGLHEINLKHGNTIFDGSQQMQVAHKGSSLPCNVDEDLYKYFWWTLWKPNATEANESITFNANGTTSGSSTLFDDTVVSIINLNSTHLRDTHLFYDINSVDTVITNTWSTSNNAKITFTPHTNNTDWLVLGSELFIQSRSDRTTETRLNSTGSVNDVLPHVIRKGEAQGSSPVTGLDNVEQDKHTFARVFNLDNSTATTFEVEIQTYDNKDNPNNDVRLQSQVLALDLSRFADYAWVWTPNNFNTGGAEYGDQIANIVVESFPTDGELFVLSDIGVDNDLLEARVQIDGTDVLPDFTTDSYDFNGEVGGEDISRWGFAGTENVMMGNHTVTTDVSDGGGGAVVTQNTLLALMLDAEEILVNGTSTPPPPATVCMEVRLMSVDVGQDLSTSVSPTFGDWKEVCSTTAGGADILRTLTFTFTPSENPFEAEEVGIVQLKRHGDNSTSDNYVGRVFSLFGELQWIVAP